MVGGPHLGLQGFPWDPASFKVQSQLEAENETLESLRPPRARALAPGKRARWRKATRLSQLTPPKAGMKGLGSRDLAGNKDTEFLASTEFNESCLLNHSKYFSGRPG